MDKIKAQAHLKHMMFNDCYSMHRAKCNHNAMDRCCVRENWEHNLGCENFEELYETHRQRYIDNKTNFDDDGSYDEATIEAYAIEQASSWLEYLAWKNNGGAKPKETTPLSSRYNRLDNFSFN